MPAKQAVVHVGPDPCDIGGMSSVICALVQTADYTADSLVSWRPKARFKGVLIAVRAALKIMGPLRRTRPLILHFHLSERGSWCREGLLLVLAKKNGYQTAITLHGADFVSWTSAPWPAKLVRYVLQHADDVFALHEFDQTLVRRLAPLSAVTLISNPVPRQELPFPDEKEGLRVLFLGEMSLRKGLDVLVEAWPSIAQATGATLAIAGPSHDVDVEVATLVGVTIVGSVPMAAAQLLIRSADVIVLPSRAEALPMVLIEAMALQVPWVSTAIAGIPRLAISGGGIVVTPGSAAELGKAVTALLLDADKRRAMGLAGRSWYLANATPEAVHLVLSSSYSLSAQRNSNRRASQKMQGDQR